MRRNPGLWTALTLLAAALAGGALAGCGGDGGEDERGAANGGATAPRTEEGTSGPRPEGETAPAPRVPTIVVRDGEPVGGVEELEFSPGDTVRFRVRSDAADHVHVHGYDLIKDVPAGGAVAFSFPADIEGIFEIELEERGVHIGELRISP